MKTKSNLVSTAETAAVETREATAGYCEEEGALSSAAHGKIDTLPRHLLLVGREQGLIGESSTKTLRSAIPRQQSDWNRVTEA